MFSKEVSCVCMLILPGRKTASGSAGPVSWQQSCSQAASLPTDQPFCTNHLWMSLSLNITWYLQSLLIHFLCCWELLDVQQVAGVGVQAHPKQDLGVGLFFSCKKRGVKWSLPQDPAWASIKLRQCEGNGLTWRWCLGNTETTSRAGKWRKDEKPLADKAAHLIRHPQASPSAWQSSPLGSGCRTDSQLRLICPCKGQSKAPSVPEGSLIKEPLLGHPTTTAELRCRWHLQLGTHCFWAA